MASVDEFCQFEREIHNIENSPFRTKFDNISERLKGNSCIGCISDADPQPLLIKSKFGMYAICIVGYVANIEELTNEYLRETSGIFQARSGNKVNSTELVASLMERKDNILDGIKYAQEVVKGSLSIVLLSEDGSIYAARDYFGRLPVNIGKNKNGYCVSFESFAFEKLGYVKYKELKSGEIV
jgi:amidophosphoribosyltransferase